MKLHTRVSPARTKADNPLDEHEAPFIYVQPKDGNI
jgi:hypothetical protein